MIHHIYGRKWRGTKKPLDESERGEWKSWLKAHIQKMKIMASCPITSWQIDGETVERVSDFILGGSKITADGDCNHEIKRHLLLGREVMTNLDSILKSRDITLPTKVHLVKALVFPSSHVWMWELDYKESWAPKYWSFSFSISPSNVYSGLISLRMDCLGFLAVQGTLKSLLQHHSSKAPILWRSAFFIVQLSHPYMTTGKNQSFD